MPLLTLRELSLAYGHVPLLDHVSTSVEKGDRIALIGRNGEGKSTLLRVLTGAQKPDGGDYKLQGGIKLASMAQEVPQELQGSVLDVVLTGAGNMAELLVQYHHLDPMSDAFSRLHEQIDAGNGWALESNARRLIERLELDPERDFAALSGGLKRRVLLARALLTEPDILLLDEPTNHLDVRSIEWLEGFLRDWNGTLIFITHDRSFLQALANRIWELDRGILRDFPGDFPNYLRRKQEILHAEEKANADFDKKLAAEEVWIRQGIKARRTRNEGRVRALKALREERAQRRERKGNVSLAIQGAEKSGKVVIEAKDLSYAYTAGSGTDVASWPTAIVRNLNLTIERGDKIAILGDNGVGKTTLLRLLLGQLPPSSGEVRAGTKLEVAYFDQLRNALDEEKTVVDNVADGADFLEINGERRHVLGYLQDFLFPPARSRSPVKALSGGERNRLLLAKLFTKPCNVLVLDEPTNDLDVETLELLEELLIDYKGTLLIISHDREFVDNVATSVLAFEGDGVIREYVGGYQDWLRQRPVQATRKEIERKAAERKESERKAAANQPEAATKPAADKKKLSYKDQRELDQLPALIEKLESEQQALQQQLADPAIYRERAAEAAALTSKLATLDTDLQKAYARWEALDAGG
ncbi:ATP-binding cassette domain-containing protein [Permianibacter sp. IMCC34836]|uniref:ATP-binding cassette domain-containing protein n=1 Tax=Permianibacter fluminis TaxID=2738515 RepID=UPI001554ED2F|nr:ATP-binding cassette domain-containing protein [Permianibacter fluminis]NQD35862.1 ATP-binding cassette domain-containing protein [Permianibacter fluminis]